MKIKKTYFIKIFDLDNPNYFGIGECSPLLGLSPEYDDSYEGFLVKLCKDWETTQDLNYPLNMKLLDDYPSIKFGVEMAIKDLRNKGNKIFFENSFAKGESDLPINGLIWMGSKEFMLSQIKQKLKEGYGCIKIKVGGIDFNDELELLKYIRKEFSPDDITIRVDANGAFSPEIALEKLKKLSEFGLHSIEQPIKQGQLEQMALLCEESPIPIALDEELIGIKEKKNLLKVINPPLIVLKPSLLGGFEETQKWIDLAENSNICWWVTSALESNIGLNAIAQLTSAYPVNIPQGLGTGMLYTNNIPSPLMVESGKIYFDNKKDWELSLFE